MAGKKERTDNDVLNDMIRTGTFFANPLFKIKAPSKRFGKRLSFRLDGGEIMWGSVCAIFVGIIVLILFFTIGGGTIPKHTIGLMFWGPVAWVAWPGVAFALGRKLHYVSPFTAKSGEGASAWFRVTTRNINNKLLSMIGLVPIVYNPVLTVMKDQQYHRSRQTMAREWIGIVMAPDAPFVKDPEIVYVVKNELHPKDIVHEDYPGITEIIDVVQDGKAHTSKRESLRKKAALIDDNHKARSHYADLKRREERERLMEEGLATPDSFWDE